MPYQTSVASDVSHHLSSQRLFKKLSEDLPGVDFLHLNRDTPKPALLLLPGVGRTYAYLWNLTRSRPGTSRPTDEMKAQLIVPGYKRGMRQSLLHHDAPTVLMAYSGEFDSYCLWDARQRPFPAYSANLQATATGCRMSEQVGTYVEDVLSSRSTVRWRLYSSSHNLKPSLVAIARFCLSHSSDAPVTYLGLPSDSK